MKRRLLAIVMALALILSAVPTAFAASGEAAEGPKKYVSLGDSMSNGLGLGGGYDATGHQGYLEIDKYSYPAMLAEHYGWDLTQLAVSCVRLEDLHFILDYGTEGAYPGDVWTDTMLLVDYRWYQGAEETAKVYQNAIAQADVVTMAGGNCNIGVYFFDMLVDALGMGSTYGQDYSYATLENALQVIGADGEAKAMVLGIGEELRAYLGASLPEGLVNLIVDRATYVAANYVVHFAGTMDRIVELNPDVEVIILGLMNTMIDYEMDIISGGETMHLDFEAIMDMLYKPLNGYMAGFAAAKQLMGAYAEADMYYAKVGLVQTLALAYKDEYAENEAFFLSRFVPEIAGMMGMSWLSADMVLAYRNAVRGAQNDEEKYAAIGAFIYQMGLDYNTGMNIVMAVEAYNMFEAYLLDSVNQKPVINLDEGIYDQDGNMSEGMTSAIMALYTRFALASGMSAHPSKQGHRDMYEIIAAAYGENTAVDQTIDNLRVLINALLDELKAQGGDEWEEYIDMLSDLELYAVELDEAVRAEVAGKIAEITEMLEVAEGDVDWLAVISDVWDILEKVYTAFPDVEYAVNEDSFYVALGDGSAVSESYVDQLAAELGVNYVNLAQSGLMVEDLFAVIEENAEIIAKANLITVDIGSSHFADYAKNQMFGALAEIVNADLGAWLDNKYFGAALKEAVSQFVDLDATVEPMDWESYLDEEELASLNETLAEMKASLLESGVPEVYTVDFGLMLEIPGIKPGQIAMNIPVADLMVFVVESYLYGYVTFAMNYADVFDMIHEVAPEAELMVVGMYNPYDELTIEFGEESFAMGEYIGYAVKAMNAHLLSYAIMTPKTTYIPVYETESVTDVALAEGSVNGLMGLLNAFISGEAAGLPSEAGYTYIKDQILNALNVIEGVPYLLGDVNLDGYVDSMDTNILFRYANGDATLGELSEAQLLLADVNGDGYVDSMDTNILFRYANGDATLTWTPVEILVVA